MPNPHRRVEEKNVAELLRDCEWYAEALARIALEFDPENRTAAMHANFMRSNFREAKGKLGVASGWEAYTHA